ncbi:Probable xyloglucan endotransglucosylase/hydrolase protein 30 [Striga hermonthica]|uniref:Xyloglucan endotransglucosylase/hydrolase n=1 Tax=Striga hermonthica TaxID=68872 RepID=A0A9N7MLS6_STRHE|nr:Probable xyloglucan endotransglucosylase/hydrolase protein 30 [Striga hermonthica]
MVIIRLSSKYCYPPIIILLHLIITCAVAAAVAAAFNGVSTVSYSKGFSPLFGGPNIKPSPDHQSVQLHLNQYTGIFYIDDTPIREITRNETIGADFPSKPMRLYATIWDASDWATSGGKYRANYKYAPFVAEFTDLVLHGCATDMLEEVVVTGCALSHNQLASADFATITRKQEAAMKRFRSKYMYYSYCYDTVRYPVPLPECVIDPVLREKFKDTGRLKFDEKHHRRRFKKRRQDMGGEKYGNQEDV